MRQPDRFTRAVVLSCVLEGAILLGIFMGFAGSGWTSIAGVSLTLLALSALAVLAHRVTTGRW
jgi:hypothetical protein